MSSILFSIVSHGQGELISELLFDLDNIDLSHFDDVKIVITLNIPEDETFLAQSNRSLIVIRNLRPIGYGSNHNQAFAISHSDYFVVLNPDVRISGFLISKFIENRHRNWGCVAPKVFAKDGTLEDNSRKYPTIAKILKRVLLRRRSPEYSGLDSEIISVDWVAGMFILFSSDVFRDVGGFDNRYFMYLEDADICKRIRQQGFGVYYDLSQSIVHDARRSSFKSLTHFKLHIRSMFRFLFKM